MPWYFLVPLLVLLAAFYAALLQGLYYQTRNDRRTARLIARLAGRELPPRNPFQAFAGRWTLPGKPAKKDR